MAGNAIRPQFGETQLINLIAILLLKKGKGQHQWTRSTWIGAEKWSNNDIFIVWASFKANGTLFSRIVNCLRKHIN
jgi:hypothetical protein